MRHRSRRGSGLAESVVAAIVLIPIALCLLDLIVLVNANAMNDTAAKNAARAAANQPEGGLAKEAALSAISSFRASSIVNKIDLTDLLYDGNSVTCQITMKVHLPVPFPGLNDLTFVASDTEPVLTQKE